MRSSRIQKMTKEKVDIQLLEKLSEYCAEFLVHAVDVEGKNAGINDELVGILSDFAMLPVTYAGGVHDYEDIALLGKLGKGRINVTVGSALDLFGGKLSWREVHRLCKEYRDEACAN